jgi:aspartate/methionine/tyrosine aminotransferase
MATYEGGRLEDLRSTVRFCQENGIFLIADNIFQDMLFPAGERRFEEIFLHADGLDGIVKIYGPSKDVPFFGGYRMGYWIGDPRLLEGFRAAAGISNTGVNTLSLVLFAFHLYFRALRLTGKQPALDDMGLFADTVFGCTSIMNRIRDVASHRRLFDGQRLLERLVSLDLYASYQREMARTEEILGTALRRLHHFAAGSVAFSDRVNHDIGSVLFLRANPQVFPGDDDELFHVALKRAKIGVLPGSGFGLERMRGQAWFRVTTTHAPIDDIVADLAHLESVLLR